jgi:hypothetical protein
MTKIIDILEDTINKFPKGYVFTCLDFDIEVKRKETIVEALNLLVNK